MGMEIMGGLSAFGGGLVGYVVPFLFVLTIVVFFHELGHFLMARWCGIRVLVFSIGFGPEIAGFNDRYGTRWKISAVPARRLREILRRRECGKRRLIMTAAAAMSEADKKDSFIFQPVRSRAPWSLPGRSRISCWQSPFSRHFHDRRQADHERACRYRAGRKCGRRRPASSPAIWCCRSTARRSKASPTCSVSSASVPASRSQLRSSAAECTVDA